MMRNRVEDFWKKAADDGASAPLGVDVVHPRADVEDLMRAWSRERGQCIEFGMLLNQSSRLISRLVVTDCLSQADRKRARALLLAIQYTLRSAEADGA
jgi:hypothetical protein